MKSRRLWGRGKRRIIVLINMKVDTRNTKGGEAKRKISEV